MTSPPAPLSFPPGDIAAVRRHLSTAGPDLAPCGVQEVVLGDGVLERTGEVLQRVLAAAGRPAGGPRPSVAVVVDDVLIRRGTDDVKALVRAAVAGVADVRDVVLRDGHTPLHAGEDVVAAAERAVAGADAVVSVGGGTVTDVAKLASVAEGGLPHVVVQTAASVDGFSDDVSVVLRDGVKRTVPSRWPDAVVTDVATVAGAPEAMNRAGLGEIMSMFTAPADWRLASLLGVDRSFHPAPTSLFEAVADGIDDWSPGLAHADARSAGRLAWALVVRGVATGVAGTTACLSGVEHLVSHMLDLHHASRGEPTGLHGAQVGAASVAAAAAWEVLRERVATRAPAVTLPEPDAARARVERAFAHLDADGRVVAECWRDYSAKLAAWHAQRDEVAGVLARWAEVEPELSALLRPSDDIARQLVAGGAPARLAELDPPAGDTLASWALGCSALMRNRSTVVDLLTVLGWWGDDDVAEVLVRADDAVARAVPAGAGR